MAFSKQEFDTMIDELLFNEPISFNMLCNIAEKTLRNKVKSWCKADKYLNGRGLDDDIMQEIQIRLIKTSIPFFLLRDGADAPINYDPEGFSSWMFKVAENIKKDFAKKVKTEDYKTGVFDDTYTEGQTNERDLDIVDENREKLKKAFSDIMSAKSSVYKILTWVAQFVFVIDFDITKIQSNDAIIKEFEEKTLFEMYDMLLMLSKKIDWIVITKSENKKILEELNKYLDENTVYGDVKYKDFFMKVNGEKSGKKSISDWVNRMNNMLRKKDAEKNNLNNGGEGQL